MADSVADITRTSGNIVWRGEMLSFQDRDDYYVKLTRLGKRSASIGFSSRELVDLRELVKELIRVEEEAHEV